MVFFCGGICLMWNFSQQEWTDQVLSLIWTSCTWLFWEWGVVLHKFQSRPLVCRSRQTFCGSILDTPGIWEPFLSHLGKTFLSFPLVAPFLCRGLSVCVVCPRQTAGTFLSYKHTAPNRLAPVRVSLNIAFELEWLKITSQE